MAGRRDLLIDLWGQWLRFVGRRWRQRGRSGREAERWPRDLVVGADNATISHICAPPLIWVVYRIAHVESER